MDFEGQGDRSEPRRSPIALTGRGISVSQTIVLTLTFNQEMEIFNCDI